MDVSGSAVPTFNLQSLASLKINEDTGAAGDTGGVFHLIVFHVHDFNPLLSTIIISVNHGHSLPRWSQFSR